MTEDLSLEDTIEIVPLRPTPQAAGIITGWDSTRPVHHVAITDGLEATLRSGNSALTCSVSVHGIPGEARSYGDVTITVAERGSVVIRVGELVALGEFDVLSARPPAIVEGRAYDRETVREVRGCSGLGGVVLDARPRAGRRALAHAIHHVRFDNDLFLELDGCSIDDAIASAAFERVRAIGDRGSVYVSNLDRACPWFIRALGSIVEPDVCPTHPMEVHTSIIVSLDDDAAARRADPRYEYVWKRLRVEPLCDRATVVPLIIVETLRRLGAELTVSAKFVEAMLNAVMRDDLEVVDVVHATRDAAR
jgi:hypothetical protein